MSTSSAFTDGHSTSPVTTSQAESFLTQFPQCGIKYTENRAPLFSLATEIDNGSVARGHAAGKNTPWTSRWQRSRGANEAYLFEVALSMPLSRSLSSGSGRPVVELAMISASDAEPLIDLIKSRESFTTLWQAQSMLDPLPLQQFMSRVNAKFRAFQADPTRSQVCLEKVLELSKDNDQRQEEHMEAWQNLREFNEAVTRSGCSLRVRHLGTDPARSQFFIDCIAVPNGATHPPVSLVEVFDHEGDQLQWSPMVMHGRAYVPDLQWAQSTDLSEV